jgi:hypothetical protein
MKLRSTSVQNRSTKSSCDELPSEATAEDATNPIHFRYFPNWHNLPIHIQSSIELLLRGISAKTT